MSSECVSLGMIEVSVRMIGLVCGVLTLILVPFFLFDTQLTGWTTAFIENSHGKMGEIAVILSALLAADILLPVPSSLVSTAAGYLTGLVPGFGISFTGMTAGCVLGYWLGGATSIPLRRLDSETTDRLSRFFNRHGMWAIAIARAVPVLAEASVLFAGMSRMNFSKFIVISSLSNLGISLVYASIGAYALSANSFLIAFGGSMLIPLVAMGVKRIVT